MKTVLSILLTALLLLSGAAAAESRAVIPDLEIPEKTIPDNAALALVRDMKAGWNLGNTFDAVNCTWLQNPLDYESGWCGVKTSEKLIGALQAAGFRTLRIPVSWHEHMSEDFLLDADWLDRVYEVASWAYGRGMYVILNIHHDNEKGFYYPDSEHAESSGAYMRAVWSQLAEKFADWDEHLIFEGINEPRLKDTRYEWWWTAGDPACRDAMEQIVRLNQVFVDTVRAAGGKNGDRYLMVPAYDANPDYACADAFRLPEDSAENRIILSVHAYTPYDFALEQPGISRFSLENKAQLSSVSGFLDRLYRKYVAQGIPVVVGEFGAMEKQGNLQDRVDWVSWYVASARARGIPCCWWDNHVFEGTGERFGLFDRTTGNCVNPEILEAIMKYSGEDAQHEHD